MNFELINILSLPSTNKYLSELISQNKCNEGLVIKTDHQTAGKGLGLNNWESEKGKNLNFSLLLKPLFIKPENQFVITQIISVSILNACNSIISNGDFSIKWPNDIYSKNKKLSGVLVQNVIKGNNISESVIGIGINVNQTKFVSNAPNPISLKQIAKQSINLDDFLNEILVEIEKNYERLRVFSDSSWLERKYLENLYRYNQSNFYTDKTGQFEGKIVGIDKYGRLKVHKADEQTEVYAYKEVEFII